MQPNPCISKPLRSRPRRFLLVLAAALIAWSAPPMKGACAAAEKAKKAAPPSFVRLRITHRVHAQFQDTLTVAMNERQTVGDSEFDFEVIEFYPHFAIIDSTHLVVSLSDEPKNPAFKVRIYQGEKTTEDTWAFYGVDLPHFARTSFLAFQVLAFEYRGKVIGSGGSKAAEKRSGKEKR